MCDSVKEEEVQSVELVFYHQKYPAFLQVGYQYTPENHSEY